MAANGLIGISSKEFGSTERFCRAYDEVRNFLRPTRYRGEKVSLGRRRAIHVQRVAGICQLSGADYNIL